MIQRLVTPFLYRLLKGFPIVTLTGPRQSGKTTLAKMVFPHKPYISLEDPDMQMLALEDPRGFLKRFPDGGVLDEVQRVPQLVSYLQGIVDKDRRMGLFLLTGSQQFGLMSRISQSLAGRTGFIELLPFSLKELQESNLDPTNLNALLLQGGYPSLYDRPITVSDWFSAYVRSYIERDVRQLLEVKELALFQKFVRLCAGRSGQILNYSSLATDCGISHNTARAWISVLESSYIVYTLQPYHESFNKRLIKSPKLYFYDTGLLCWLLGIHSIEHLEVHPLRGHIFETFVVSEIKKNLLERGASASLYFWRDSGGTEIDLLIEDAGFLLPIEIKSGQTITPDFFTGLQKWQSLAGNRSVRPFLIYGGEEGASYKGIRVLGWNSLHEIST